MMARSQGLVYSLIALSLGLFFALVLGASLGESPSLVLHTLLNGAFGSATQFGYSLYYATPLILTGLSVAWSFKVGLCNIGAEGQMTMGGVAMAVTALLLPNLQGPVAVPLALVSGFLVGGIWGAIAGWMRAYRGCHEVLATILLNFVAYGLAGFFIIDVFRNENSASPETPEFSASYLIGQLPSIGGTSPLNASLFVALLAVVVFSFVFRKTLFGFRQRWTGEAPGSAALSGVRTKQQIVMAMFISGGLAGLAAASPVLGYAHKAREGFTAGAGFMGIAVALLGRNQALGVLAAAFLFGCLTKGSLDLDLDTRTLTRDLAVVIQAVIVILVASQIGALEHFARLKVFLLKSFGASKWGRDA